PYRSHRPVAVPNKLILPLARPPVASVEMRLLRTDMTSLGALESLVAPQPLFERVGEAAAAAGEAPLALFIGVNHVAYLFTTERLLILKRAKPLARELAGRKIIDFMRAPV